MTTESSTVSFIKRNYKSWIGFLISGVLLWRTLKAGRVDLSHIKLEGEEWFFFITGILLFVASIWMFSIRTKLLWVTQKRTSESIKAYSSIVIGNFYNCLLPGNLGEGVRVWHFSQKNRVSLVASASTVVTEKWIDAQLFAVVVTVLMIGLPFIGHYVTYTLISVALLVIATVVAYVFLTVSKTFERNVWGIIISLHRKTGVLLYKLYYACKTNVSHLLKNRLLLRYILVSLSILVLNLGQFYFVLKAVGVTEQLITPYTLLTLASAMMVIAIIPSAPSNIGVMHYGVFSTLQLLAQQHNVVNSPANLQSFALFGVYVHLSYLIPEIIMGLAFVLAERKTLFGHAKSHV